MSTTLEAATSAEERAKDVFISYSSQDRAWVCEYLWPVLEAAGLSCVVDQRDFEVGKSFIESMREWVARCRHTVVVLTPAWWESPWAEFEAELAHEKDESGTERGVVPLMLRKCPVSGNIRWRTHLDLTEFDRRDAKMLQLLESLGADKEARARAQARMARKGLAALRELMSESRVQAEVAEFSSTFAAISEKIDVVTRGKHLHELFHTVDSELRGFSPYQSQLIDGLDVWRKAARCIAALRNALAKLIEYAENTFDPDEITWTGLLRPVCDELVQAGAVRETERLVFCVDQIRHAVGLYSKDLNDDIVSNVRQMPLQRLIDNLRTINERISRFDFDGPAQETYDKFLNGLEPLQQLADVVRCQVHNHSLLQQISLQLQRPVKPAQLEYHWRMLISNSVRALIDEGPGPSIKHVGELGRRIDERLKDPRTARDELFAADLQCALDEFDGDLQLVFGQVDYYLLTNVCGRLRQLRDELEAILTEMQTE